MANRRMFSYRIINSARFLKMPLESQSLYFHLGIRADDDGVAEAYPVMKLLGATEDNLKILISKNFIKLLNDDLVIFITDFHEHNTIRADRKVNSIYKHLLEENNINTINPKPRSDVKDNSKRMSGQSTDNQRTAQVKLSKVKLSKDKVLETDVSLNKEIVEILNLFKESINPTINFGHKTHRSAIKDLIKVYGYEKTVNTVKYAISIQGKNYTPTITTPYQLKNKISDLMVYAKKENNKKSNFATI